MKNGIEAKAGALTIKEISSKFDPRTTERRWQTMRFGMEECLREKGGISFRDPKYVGGVHPQFSK